MQVVVTGSLAFDQIMIFPESFEDHIMPDKLHVMSVSFLVDHLHKNFGGVAGNISYNLGMLGLNPVCVGNIGQDGEDYKLMLEKNGVNIDFLNTIHDDYTGTFVVITDKKDCQIAGFYPGAMKNDEKLKLADIVLNKDEEFFLTIGPTMPKAMVSLVREAKELGLRTLYSPAQQIPRLSKEELLEGIEQAEVLVGNDYEIALIEKKIGLSHFQLLDMVNVLVTTLGERGSKIEQKNSAEMMIGVAKPKEVADPTGSGDAYIAGFLAGYVENKSLIECGQMAATTAAYAVESFGTTGHKFSKALFENRKSENFG